MVPPWSRQKQMQEAREQENCRMPQVMVWRQGVLSPMETLAQSVSTIAPTADSSGTIPLVCALAGNGTWLAYVLATSAILLVALCVSKFGAPTPASPGSLYSYASMVLPSSVRRHRRLELAAGAYVATGSSVMAALSLRNLLLRDATGHGASAVFSQFSYGNIRLDCLA